MSQKPLLTKILITISFLKPLLIIAQPTIFANNLPKMFDHLVFANCSYATSFNTIDSGANAFWDASDLVPYDSDSSVIDYIKVPAGYMSKFPNATLCRKENRLSYITYEMFSLESDQYFNWGNISNLTPFTSIYSNSQLNLKFPFTYNTKFSDNFTYKYKFNMDSSLVNGNAFTRGAGFGKLKLPNNVSYNNALLVITNNYWQKSTGEKYKSYSFDWYVPEFVGVVLSFYMSFDYSNGQWNTTQPSIYFQKNPLKNLANVNNASISKRIALFPNPVLDLLTIETEGIIIKEIQVLNTVGQLVLKSTEPNIHVVDVSTLTKGNYTFIIKDKNDNVFQKQFIK